MRASRSVSFSEEGGDRPNAITSPEVSNVHGVRDDGNSNNRSPSTLLQFQTRQQPTSSPLVLRPSTPNSVRSNSVSSLYSYQDLARRPRSNPRNRTPMRQESPIVTTTIRIGAGNTIRGTIVTPSMTSNALDRARHAHVTPEGTTQRSSKQARPSHRKVRRWNNDRFVGIASEISDPKIKEVFLRNESAQDILLEQLPVEYRNCFSKLSAEEKHQFVKHPTVAVPTHSTEQPSSFDQSTTPQQMWLRIHPRLKNILLRACKSPANQDILSAFECILIDCISSHLKSLASSDDIVPQTFKEEELTLSQAQQILSTILMQPPLVTTLDDDQKKMNVRFLFDESSSKGAYYRMFLHSLCQFHGWSATSTKSSNKNGHLLVVTVKKGCHGITNSNLMAHIQQQIVSNAAIPQRNESIDMPNMSMLRVS
eukprot:CAMPEP_0197825162 /NCGR_PEP_ID=MMETSP1437-20131217/2296_1 /TAXON_ID=49252 ORGANISM="Eucampia antarctica, Strain CCMP1452" /NCGR_SAMPLE_ID=MMETSP1437 /ASSEMBLY_ACC=CAM_ASM_001096 /LENGTH=423 /DNA_ID=CAMNT_0043425053 /DNA_START=117 /DNA_END=1388 /DNA_ORIENTATION=+